MNGELKQVLDECDKHRRLNGDLQQENKELRIAFINSKEDVAEWKKSYESKQNEYNQLNQVYELKCNVLKQTEIQLTECKSVLEEHKRHIALIESELLASRQECDELKLRCRSHSEAHAKQESRFFALKEEYSDAFCRYVEFLERKLGCPSDLTSSDDNEPLRIAAILSDLARLASTLDECRAALHANPTAAAVAHPRAAAVYLDAAAEPANSPSAARHGPCESRLSTSSDGGDWPGGATPRRSRSRAAAAVPLRTPGTVLLTMESLSPSSLREHAESLAISNDLLRQVRGRRRAGRRRVSVPRACGGGELISHLGVGILGRGFAGGGGGGVGAGRAGRRGGAACRGGGAAARSAAAYISTCAHAALGRSPASAIYFGFQPTAAFR